jgi:hypothetical protein
VKVKREVVIDTPPVEIMCGMFKKRSEEMLIILASRCKRYIEELSEW